MLEPSTNCCRRSAEKSLKRATCSLRNVFAFMVLEWVFLSVSEKCRDDVHEKDLHDGHARKDHGVADVRPVGRCELVRVGEDRRIATGARNDAGYLVVGH